MSVATLGFAVDSSPLTGATKALNALTAAAKPAAAAAAEIGKASANAATSTAHLSNAAQKAADGGAKALTTQTGLARHELINLSRQIQDIGVSLVSGQSPFTVLMQQGTQVADIFGSSKTGTVGGAFKQIAGGIASVITPARLLGAAFVAASAGAVVAVTSVARLEKQFDDASSAIGTTLGQLHALDNAAAFKGIDTSAFLEAMQKFGASVYDAQHGMGGLAETFRANNTHAKSFNDHLEKAADLIKNASSNQQRLQLLQQMGLPATMEWVRFLSQGSQGIKDAVKAAGEFNTAADQQLIAKARQFDEAWNKATKNLATGFRNAVLEGASLLDSLSSKAIGFAMKLPGIGASIPSRLLSNSMSASNMGFDVGSRMTGSTPVDDFYSGLGSNAPGNANSGAGTTKNAPDVQHALQIEQQRIALLGQTASAMDAVRQVELQVAQARLAGVSISEKQVNVLKQLAYENALGITQIKAQTDAYNTEASTVGMALGAAVQYTAVQNALNEAKRQGKALTEADIAAITAHAGALGVAAQAAEEKYAADRANFELQTAGLSGVELQIAQLQKRLHGNDWQQFMDDGLAATTRLADSMKQLADAERAMFKDFLSGMQQGKSAMESLASAASSFANKLADMGANKLFDAFKSGDISKAFSLNITGSTSKGIVEGFAAIQSRASAASANPSNSFSFNGMSGGNMAVGGIAAAGVGLGIYGNSRQAGAAGQSAGGGALSGALSGAMAGSAIAGPVGAVVGGIGGAIMGLFGVNDGQRQAAKKAKEDWEAARGAAEAFGNQLAGGGQGSLTSSMADAKAQVEQFSLAAFKGKDRDAAHKLAQQYDQFVLRTSQAFQDSFGGVVDALNSGLGPNSPFASGAANVKDVGDQLKGFIEDAGTAMKHITGGDAQAQAHAMAQATAAAQAYALSLLGQAPVLTEVQSAIQHLNGTAAQLRGTLVELGMSSADAAAAIQAGVLASMRQLADTFTNGIQREINAASGQDYKNALADLIAKFQSNLADAASLGLGPDLVNKWFKVSAQKIVNDAGLAGGAIADLVQQFPQLSGVVTDSTAALTAATQATQATLEATTQSLLAIYDEAAAGVGTARQDLTAAYQAESSALQSTIDKTRSYVASLKEFGNGLKLNSALSPLSPQAQYLAAQAQARQDATLAQGGDADAQARLQGSLSSYLDQSKSFNASTEAYYRDFEEVQGILTKSEAAGTRQIDVAQQQLTALNAQVSGLVTINSSVLSVAAAITMLKDAMAAQKQAASDLQPAAAASTNLEALYKSVLGRSPDAKGAAYWSAQIAGGMKGEDLLRSFVGGAVAAGQRDQVDPKLLAKYRLQNGGIVGAYADGGMVGNGLFGMDSVLARFAGGGNIALAGGEYVMPAAQTQMFKPQLEAMRASRTASNDNSDDFKVVARALAKSGAADTDRLIAKFDEFIDVLDQAPEKNKAAFRQLIGQSKQRAS